MGPGDGEAFVWRELPESAARIEHPLLRQPLTLVVDDPTPGYNPAYFHHGFRRDVAPFIPRDLLARFADLVEETGLRGKFSVIPFPFGLGRLDREVAGLPDAEVRYFLDVVRARIAPHLDITPEALTHWNALDLPTGQLLPLWEHAWCRGQDRTGLTRYLSLALEILNAVDLPADGITSPWNFGTGVEDEYAEAILAAQQQVNGRSLSWYFMEMETTSRHVPPRLRLFRPTLAEAVVSVVTCHAYDFGVEIWRGNQADPDILITADGRGGRLAKVLSAGGPAVFHTHWQTLFANGSYSGLHALREVARRVKEHHGSVVAWTRCADLARYAAAVAAVEVRSSGDDSTGLRLSMNAPFATARFTLSVVCARPVRAARLDGRALARRTSPETLADDTYVVDGRRLIMCWNLAGRQTIDVEYA